jgi:hypothetical protein
VVDYKCFSRAGKDIDSFQREGAMILLSMVLLVAIQSEPPLPAPTPILTPTPSPLRILKRTPPSQIKQGLTLSDAAKRIKLKTPGNKPLKMTNDSVKELSKGVELTTAASAPDRGSEGNARSSENEQRKTYWQEKYQAARMENIRLTELIANLESEVAKLQRDFYSRDDPAYRDGVVKPALDTALANLNQAKKDLEKAKDLPNQVLAEAQRDGAQPGWFRGLPDPRSTPRPMPTPSGSPNNY